MSLQTLSPASQPSPLGLGRLRRGPPPIEERLPVVEQAPEVIAEPAGPGALDRIDPPFENNLDATAITPEDWELYNNFKAAFDADVMEECPWCYEKWFNLRIAYGACASCRDHDNTRRPEEPLYLETQQS